MSFGSTPLSEAVKPKQVEEYSDDIVNRAVNYGMEPSYIKGWLKNNENTLTSKNKYRMDFIRYIIDCCKLEELHRIELEFATEAQQKLIDDAIEGGGIPEIEQSDISEYIEKNKALQKQLKDVIKEKGTKTLKGLQQENDKLNKRIAALQKERDDALHKYIPTLNKLTWLYDFMGDNMVFKEGYDFSNIEDFNNVAQIKELVKNE